MCFSAEASFVSAGVLVSAGAFCLREAIRKKLKRLIPLAAVPVGFGVQQFSEGLVWVGLHRGNDRLVHASAAVFLLFAVAIWPTWMCLTTVFAEASETKRKWLLAWAALSTSWLWGFYLPVFVAAAAEFRVGIAGWSLRYQDIDRLITWWVGGLYFLTSFVPVVSCSSRRVFFPGVVLAVISVLIAAWFFGHAFTSVWCFFAAVLSAWLVIQFRVLAGPDVQPPSGCQSA